jgi:uncharacterized protein YxjI
VTNYPLTLSFKIIALAPQVYVRDAGGQELLYVKQKLLKLRERIQVFADSSQSRAVYEINADRILDWNARYTFTDASGATVGGVRRHGAKSFWKASYEVFSAHGQPLYTIQEENPWIKVLDGVLGDIPVIGGLFGYFLNPRYQVTAAGTGQTVLRVIKHRTFFLESRFEIQREGPGPDPGGETPALLSVLMMVLLERERG